MIRASNLWRISAEKSVVGDSVQGAMRRINRTVRPVECDGKALALSLEHNEERLNVVVCHGKVVRCVGWY